MPSWCWLLLAGNLFCMSCPFMLPRTLAKRFLPANRVWPVWLRAKWLAAGLLLLFFWAYEAFSLWASPWLTAWVVMAYFAGAFVIDGFFRGATFCKYVCPIGQFNFVNSLVSPLEIKVRQPAACVSCATKDCIQGRRDTSGGLAQQGCELWLFQQRKAGNMDCTFCLDCVHACPHDNIGLIWRKPASELWHDSLRSGVGRLSKRPDLAALTLVLVFAAFMNALGMIGPFYPLVERLARLLHTTSRGLTLAVIFVTGLAVLPAALAALAAWLTRTLEADRPSLTRVATRFSYGLVPLGFGMWLAHYSYHFLTGALVIVPVMQNFAADIAGWPIFGGPMWRLAELLPNAAIAWVEAIFLELGLLASLVVTHRIAASEQPERPWRAAVPWWLLAVALFAAGWWILGQPMQMRGTFSVGG